jgi:hypothetical protein
MKKLYLFQIIIILSFIVVNSEIWISTAQAETWYEEKEFRVFICGFTTPTQITKVITEPKELWIFAQTRNARGTLSATGKGGKTLDFDNQTAYPGQMLKASIKKPYPIEFPVTVTFTFQCLGGNFMTAFGRLEIQWDW